jgi:hypothetical protein
MLFSVGGRVLFLILQQLLLQFSGLQKSGNIHLKLYLCPDDIESQQNKINISEEKKRKGKTKRN